MQPRSHESTRKAISSPCLRGFVVAFRSALVAVPALYLDPADLVCRRNRERAPLSFDLSNARKDVVLDLGEFLLGDFAELQAHLRFEQLLAQRRVVLGLRFGGRDDLVEDESKAADQQRVQDEHDSFQLSAFSCQLADLSAPLRAESRELNATLVRASTVC